MKHYHDIQSSLLRFCSDFADYMCPLGVDLDVVNLDSHTDEAHWPERDFIGLGEFHVDIDEIYGGQCMFGVSTRQDSNLFRMGKVMNELTAQLVPTSRIPVFDAQTGIPVGELYVLNGTRVTPPMPTNTQPIQPVGISFESNLQSS